MCAAFYTHTPRRLKAQVLKSNTQNIRSSFGVSGGKTVLEEMYECKPT